MLLETLEARIAPGYTPVPLTYFVPPPAFVRPYTEPAVVFSPVYNTYVLRPYQYDMTPKPITIIVPPTDTMKVIYIPRER